MEKNSKKIENSKKFLATSSIEIKNKNFFKTSRYFILKKKISYNYYFPRIIIQLFIHVREKRVEKNFKKI